MDLLMLIFGGRKAREAYREYTQAIISRTAAQRAWNEWLEDQRQGLRRDREAIETGQPLEPVRSWSRP